ncbi:MAG: TetR family transcriptional regulator C-terminal domain-containing protein [Sphingosinicella sp.]|nr:TetR family transcriptional regulator C-terminal domain-containing protein [Sphingosinicella sp.]
MPRKIDLDVQRRMVADAAITVIGEAGVEGAGLREVARAAKLTTGAVTHYFDGKDAVLEAALNEIVRRTLARIESGQDGQGVWSVQEFIDRACRHLPLDAAGRKEWRVWLAFWGRAIADGRLRTINKRYYAAIVDQTVGSLQRVVGIDASMTPEELRKRADAVIAAIDGIGVRATLDPASWSARRQRETLERLLLPMLLPPKSN